MTFLGKLALVAATANAADIEWNYINNGRDWPALATSDTWPDNWCGSTTQSPIDLSTERSEAFDYPVLDASTDDFRTIYANQKNVVVNDNKHTTQVDLNADTTNMFFSNVATDLFGVGNKFTAAQFHFHAGSEHTIDGVRHDLEMHTVHVPVDTSTRIGYGALGIMFSVNDYTADLSYAEQAIIDNFFESLDWSEDSPTVDLVAYGTLVEMVDTRNRWVYEGSVTTPPCATSVYWNVLTTIYPVSADHFAAFTERLAGMSPEVYWDQGLDVLGNWREIQTIDNQNVVLVKSDANVVEEADWSSLTSASSVMAALLIVLCTLTFVSASTLNKLEKK